MSRSHCLCGADHLNRTLQTSTSSLTERPCSCITEIAGCLGDLQKPASSGFGSSLTELGRARELGWRVLNCAHCPSRFVTTMQNAHMLGVLVMTLAERSALALSSFQRKAELAQAAAEMLSLEVRDQTEATSLGNEPPSFIAIKLQPSEWLNIMSACVQQEINDPSHGQLQLISSMEIRQLSWHDKNPSPDWPKIYSDLRHNTKDYACLKLPREAKCILEGIIR